jgi:putative MATE family efflux protein
MKDEKRNILDDDNIGRLLFKLALPAFVGMFVMSLYNIVNTIFIGRFVGSLGIAGLSIVFPIQMIAIGIGLMMGIGGASLMSISLGSGNIKKAEHALGNAVTCTFIVSLILMVLGLAKMDFCLTVMGASKTILPYARDYMRIIMIGLFFQTFAMAFNSLIRAEGNARVPMIGMLAGAILNIILDAIFIIHLKMGVTGAALGTVIAEMVSVSYYLYYYFSNKSRLKFHIKNFNIDWKILKSIIFIGISAFVMGVSGSISALFVNRLCLSYGGDIAVSAYGIINRIVMFALMPGIVISQGLQPIVGFNYGAGRYERILKAIKISLIAATVFCTAAFIFLELFPQIFIGVFTDDAELIAITSHAIRRVLATAYLIGFIIIGSTVFQSIGKPVQAFVTSTARATLFLIPLIIILPKFLNLNGVWWSFPLAEILTLILTLKFFLPQIRIFRGKGVQVKSQGHL